MQRMSKMAAIIAAVVLMVDPAHAQPELAAGAAIAAERESAHEKQASALRSEHRLRWDYPRFRDWQWGLSVLASSLVLAANVGSPGPRATVWRGAPPVDRAVRRQLRAPSRAGRERANHWSNVLWYSTELFPFADALLVTLVFDDLNWDVAGQLTLVHWEGLAVMGALHRLTRDALVARDRPALLGCVQEGEDYSPYCDSGHSASASFLSGHAASAFFGAGATCAQHQALSLYGHSAADWAACLVTLASASVGGLSRIVADTHWATDVLAGAALGLGTGWGLAQALHFALPSSEWRVKGGARPSLLVPTFEEGQVGVRWAGVF